MTERETCNLTYLVATLSVASNTISYVHILRIKKVNFCYVNLIINIGQFKALTTGISLWAGTRQTAQLYGDFAWLV